MTFNALGEDFGPVAVFGTATAPGGTAASIALRAPADDLAALSPTVDLLEVELAIEGEWDASTGRVPLTRQTFESMLAAASDPDVDQAAVHFGHFDPRFPSMTDGEPAVGWVKATGITQRPDGRAVLVGRIDSVPTSLVNVIKHGYRRRSVELAADLNTPAGRRYPAVLTGLGLLGRTAPAVKGLSDITSRYLSAPVAPAGGALHTVYVEGMPGDTPALPVGAAQPGHDGRGIPPYLQEAAQVPKLTDDRVRQLLGLAADANVQQLQAQLAAYPDPTAGQPAAAAAPQPPAGYVAPPGYALQPVAGQPAPAAAAAPMYGQPAAAPAAPIYAQPAAPAAPGYGQPAAVPVYGQPAAAPAAPIYAQPAPAAPGYGQPAGAPGFGQPAAVPVYGQQPGYALQPVAGQPAPAAPGYGQPAGAPAPQVAQPIAASALAPGVVALSADQWAGIQSALGLGEKDRRDRVAYAAFAAGQISAHEHAGWRAELDRDEATATRMLSLLQPNRYQVTAFGSAAAGAAPGTPAAAAAQAGAAAAFEDSAFPEVAARRRAQAAQAAQAGGAQALAGAVAGYPAAPALIGF